MRIRRKRHNERLWIVRTDHGRRVGHIIHTFSDKYQVRNDLRYKEPDQFFDTLAEAKEFAMNDYEGLLEEEKKGFFFKYAVWDRGELAGYLHQTEEDMQTGKAMVGEWRDATIYREDQTFIIISGIPGHSECTVSRAYVNKRGEQIEVP